MKYILGMLALLLVSTAHSAVLDMELFGQDAMGNQHYVEKKFWCYGTDEEPCQYTGTNWLVQDTVGRSTFNSDIYFDCSDDTWGHSTPTNQDIQTGTMIHAFYLRACK